MHTKLSEFFPVNIQGNLLSLAKTIRNLGVWFDLNFFLLMSGISVSFVLFISGILSYSEGISV